VNVVISKQEYDYLKALESQNNELIALVERSLKVIEEYRKIAERQIVPG